MSRSEWNVDDDQRSSGALPNLIAANSNSGQTTQELGHFDADRVHRGRKNTEAGGKVQLFEPAEPVSDG
jgi:hypothetical protein